MASSAMDTTTVSASEMSETTTTKQKQKNKDDAHQQKTESNQKVLNDKSMTEILNVDQEFYFILRILGIIFLALIFYIISCEMIRYSLIKFENLPEDAVLYRYQWIYCVIIFVLGIAALILAIFTVLAIVFSAIKYFIPVWVKHYYIDGKQSYKWWQTKYATRLIISLIVGIIWAIFVVESGRLILPDFNSMKLNEDRLIVYQISGLVTLMLCSCLFVFQINSAFEGVDPFAQFPREI